MKSFFRRIFRSGQQTAGPETAPRKRIDFGDKELPFAIYALGDVHGRLDLLLEAERKIEQDLEQDGGAGLIVLLGDCIDRGPDSAGVLDHLLKPLPRNMRRVVLCGNHESSFLGFIDDPYNHLWWLEFGGRQTLLSYGVDADYFLTRGKQAERDFIRAMQAAVPAAHRRFLENLPIYIRTGRFIFVHAGLRPGIPLSEQTEQDMMWIREPFLSKGPRLPPLIVIHGHTPVAEPKVGPDRICIDTGAVTTDRLTVLKIRNEKAYLLR